MLRYACIIQEGQAADRTREALEEGLRRIGRESFGDDPSATKISWRPVKKGFGWTAGEPSTSHTMKCSQPSASRPSWPAWACR